MTESLIRLDQSIFIVPSFNLEYGTALRDVPVAYKTWGTLNSSRDNVMIICHAFTGSADVEDWWGPLLGEGKAFDPERFFIFCANVLGSPYGSASPITTNPDTGRPYGPEFPATTIRDDVRIHKHVLDYLGVNSVAVAIGGSMGGMTVLEWPLCTPRGYIRHVIPIATSARHSAWCISWGEAQRQSIYSDPGYKHGFYLTQPASGLSAARMSALLTYRSRDSFESRFGRRAQPKNLSITTAPTPPSSPPPSSQSPEDAAVAAHNDGHHKMIAAKPPLFSAQSYLRYQGQKFTARFDANCYIHITRKLDTHDVARGRTTSPDDDDDGAALPSILSMIPPRALVISVASDGLFTPSEQRELAGHIPSADLVMIDSPDGHDGFLLEFAQINGHIVRFLRRELPELYTGADGECYAADPIASAPDFQVKNTSVFGEAETDLANW
ncbi:Alpha/Beta hydrolase protein [Mycena haematopus]|nr:Alpha/Beta hydrolase protein [Mycena haematopus]